MKRVKTFAITMVAALVAACGGGSGGGGGGSGSVANQDPQGIWNGTSSAGFNISSLVLENGEFYTMFSRNGLAYGIDYGTGTVSGSTISGSLQEFYIPNNSVTSGSISASFVPKSTLNGSASYANGTSTTFTTTYNSSYDTPASLSTLTGNYVGTYYTGANVRLSIASNGVVSGGATNADCSITGSATPRSSGKNVYNMSLTFSGTQCAPAPGTGVQTGVAVLGQANGQTYIYTAGLNSAKTNGFFWIGQKQ